MFLLLTAALPCWGSDEKQLPWAETLLVVVKPIEPRTDIHAVEVAVEITNTTSEGFDLQAVRGPDGRVRDPFFIHIFDQAGSHLDKYMGPYEIESGTVAVPLHFAPHETTVFQAKVTTWRDESGQNIPIGPGAYTVTARVLVMP